MRSTNQDGIQAACGCPLCIKGCDDNMDNTEQTYRPDGCLLGFLTNPLFLIFVAAVILVLLIPPPSNKQNKDATSDNDTEQVLSGNEAFSRNTTTGFNFGEINNFFYDCIGSGACTFAEDNSVDNSVQTETTETRSTTTSTTDVNGDRNVVSGGIHMCVDGTGAGYQTDQPCRSGFTEKTQ